MLFDHSLLRILGFGYLLSLLVGCTPPSDATTANQSTVTGVGPTRYPIQVVATVGMVADVVREVGGERLLVKQLMGAGVDPHLYSATRDDVQILRSADIIFYSGLMLEGKMTDTLVKVARSKPVYAVTELLDASQILEPEGSDGHADPHVWMDVSAWSLAATSIAQSLAEYDAKHADEYRARATAYQEKLAALHAYGKQVINSIPATSRVLITSHDAFNYLGRAYGLDVMGVQGLSTESEAGLQQINGLVDLIVERDVRAVFVETSVSPKSIQSLIDGAKARGCEVEIGGELYSDAMGEAGTYEGTYLGMLDHNLTTIARGLGGTAPEGGHLGKLHAKSNR